jgi:hypothetical protein
VTRDSIDPTFNFVPTVKVVPSNVNADSPFIVDEFTDVRTLLLPTPVYDVIPAFEPVEPF